ncbi:MAG: toxin-antitoxin system, antitoxin component, Xre family protein [Tychonema bourrellyi B0820]|uniref:Toxin-antitoxin system, antitoxin component, Xre family protein n=1 Tax=Tychonema bourrellyi FEM_GT703 TaxID=2040638 RepID=A0A2G4F3R6_9CYAN|nr:toxin-antitoxin system, antitoxin component, Xre family protein [Tychonema bourrellyi]MDQ2096834.1 toxin-antitoxin system, antitoxin component, Xre family protein [Tychonema bourrellyi B0820]PHX56399.1 toxin-antitoxin system, antitoxin component, Xre family protein [Tychonema bourrellyi FEM_GT703]
MSITQNPEAELMEKIRSLPPDKITVLEDFIDFLLTRSEAHLLVYTATKLSEAAFAKIWDNPEDAEYDEL